MDVGAVSWIVVTQNIFGGPRTESKPFERLEEAMKMQRLWRSTRPMWSVVIREVRE